VHAYRRGFEAFVEELCYPAIIGPDKPEAVELALAKTAEHVKGQLLIREEFDKEGRDFNYPIESRAPFSEELGR
jgi:hypothetical protein